MGSFIREETGSQIIEFGLVILPFFAFILLIVDVAWLIFAQATLQHAVREGVRFAVTSQMPAGFTHQDAAIDSVVVANAFGFLSGTGASNISIQYYNPTNLQAATGAGSNAGGNLVQITISGVQVSPMGPILRSSTAVSLSASATDVMEASPGGVPPPR